MIPFKTVTLCDKQWIDEIVMAEGSRSADYNFGNIYIWDNRYKQLVARAEGRMLTKLRYAGKSAGPDHVTEHALFMWMITHLSRD